MDTLYNARASPFCVNRYSTNKSVWLIEISDSVANVLPSLYVGEKLQAANV